MKLHFFLLLTSCAADPTEKRVHGVPIFNYDKAKPLDDVEQDTGIASGGGPKLTWLLLLKDGATTDDVHAICLEHGDQCTGEGHPSTGGVAFISIKATEERISEIIGQHANKIELVEPDLEFFTEPPDGIVEEEGLKKDEQDLNSFGSSVKPQEGMLELIDQAKKMHSKQLLESGDESGMGNSYYLICKGNDHRVKGYGPMSRNEADQQWDRLVQSCGTMVMSSSAQWTRERSQGDTNNSQIKEWWECATKKKTGHVCQQYSGPIPPGQGGGGGGGGGGNPFPIPPRRRGGGGGGGGGSPGQGPVGEGTNRWGLDRIDQRSGTNKQYKAPSGLDGTGVHVYVIDTGINHNHVDFGGRSIPTIDTSSATNSLDLKVCDPTDMTCAKDTFSHGTHVAGTIGGKQSGVATGAILHSCRVMTKGYPKADGSLRKNLIAIDWVAQNAIKPAVMSMSIGGDGCSNMMKNSVTKAYEAGILSVVAGGNIGNTQHKSGKACDQTPACLPIALTVGATSTRDQRSTYSNAGTCQDIWAPGDSILSTAHDSNTAWKDMSGTSMATPHVTGAVALLIQKYPTITPAKIHETIIKYATPDKVSMAFHGRRLTKQQWEASGAGTPNKFLYVTDYEADVPKPSGRRRRRSGGEEGDAPPTRRRRRAARRRSTAARRRRRSTTRRRRAASRRRTKTRRRRR